MNVTPCYLRGNYLICTIMYPQYTPDMKQYLVVKHLKNLLQSAAYKGKVQAPYIY